jgi:hypothetical protein
MPWRTRGVPIICAVMLIAACSSNKQDDDGGFGVDHTIAGDGVALSDGGTPADAKKKLDSKPLPLATGFGGSPMSWAVPTHPQSTTGFQSPSDTYAANTVWSTFDINGDGKPDLVHSMDQSTQTVWTPADPHWKVYLAQ